MSKAEAEAWCGPTRELESSQLSELLHRTKPEPKPVVDEDAWFCKTNEVPVGTKELTGPIVVRPPSQEPILAPMPATIDPLPGSRLFGRRTGSRKPVYPVYRHGIGGARIAIGIALLVIAIGVLLTFAV